MNDIFAMSEEETFMGSILNDIEACKKPFTEAEIYKYLLEHLYTLPPGISEKDDKALKYEILAFSFTWDNSSGSTHSASRFATQEARRDECRLIELKIGEITEDMLRYWSGRTKETINPMMKARYADLVWSFSRNLGKPADPEIARAAVDSILEMAKTKYYPNDEYIISRLKRALSLSLGIKDFNRFGKTIDIMFLIEGSITDIPDYYLDVIDSIRSATG